MLTLAYQALVWLQTGAWSPHTLSEAWLWFGGSKPEFPTWRGVEQIAGMLLNFPLSGGLILLGVASMMIADPFIGKRRQTG